MVTARGGLSGADVERSRAKYGSNELTKHKKRGFWSHFAAELADPIIRVLILALAVNLILLARGGSIAESAGILFSILAATLVSTASGYKAERTLEALEGDAGGRSARVIRAGRVVCLPCGEIVVGDTVLLSAGDAVPADGMLVSGRLWLDQSALNGESREKLKSPGQGAWEPGDPHCVLRGTLVSAGEGSMRVDRVGDATFYGSIAAELGHAGEIQSPLKERLARLARQISRIGYAAAALVCAADLVNSFIISGSIARMSPGSVAWEVLRALTLGISVIVVAVPEGLPMMISVVLSSNMFRMARDNVLVRRPVGIETAGNMNLLFCDKTGTLTRGQLRVEGLYLPDGTKHTSLSSLPGRAARLFELSLRANNGAVWSSSEPAGGNSTDRALLRFSGRTPSFPEPPVRGRVPFDSTRKYSAATVYDKGEITLIKGAPEAVLPMCRAEFSPVGEAPLRPARIRRLCSELGSQAVRVIALAYTENGVCRFLGLAGLRDGLRREAASSVERLKRAGVRVVMLTGDSRDTALAIARECGIAADGDDGVITSAELSAMSDDRARAFLPRLRVLARALPRDKSRLVRLAGEAGMICGMTGDGTNDAPALKQAPVGFAMGSGSEVARQAGDIVILDDNISSVTKAVLFGRTIFHSIRKFIVFQLTMNFCAVGVSVAAPFLGIETPVTVTQMLWINMIMDTLAGLAFAGEPPREKYMREPPRPRSEGVLCRSMLSQIIVSGLWTVAASLFFLLSPAVASRYSSPSSLLCGFFCFFVFSGVFNCFNARTERLNIASRLSANKPFLAIMAGVLLIQTAMVYVGGSAFRCVPLTRPELSFALLAALPVIPVDIIRKIIRRLCGKSN